MAPTSPREGVKGRAARGEHDTEEGENSVVLVGRVSAAPDVRELPSGDELVTLRLVVPRPGGGRTGRARAAGATDRRTVDVIDIACWTARSRRAARRLEAGDVARVEGALRRRFFRTGAGAASRYEVETTSIRALKGRRVRSSAKG